MLVAQAPGVTLRSEEQCGAPPANLRRYFGRRREEVALVYTFDVLPGGTSGGEYNTEERARV